MKRQASVPGLAVPRRPFALKVSVAALAGIGLSSAMPSFAQQANEGEVAVVQVSGVRAAAQSSLDIKQKADNVVDSIVADDIGKFPDTNVAQTLARVPGIQVRRDAGEANSVLIRGLPGIATMLNGREMFTTTGRYIQLADIPSAMLQRVDVYKSQSPELVEGGIAGVIDVRTNRPFDFKGFTLSANGGVKNQDKAKKTDPEANGLISNRWKTEYGEIGALFGLSYVRNNFHEERSFNTFPVQKDWLLPNLTGPDLVGLQGIYGERKRTAENFALQWRPNKDTEIYAEGIYSRYKNKDETDFFVGLPWWAPGDKISATKIAGTDQIDELTSHDANTILSTQARASQNTTWQTAIGAKWNAAPGLRLSTELARTKSKYDWRNPILDAMVTVPDVFVKTNLNGGAFVRYGGMDMTDPKNIYLFQLFDRYGNDKGASTDWRADASYTPASDGFFQEFSAGVRFNKRSAESIKSVEGSMGAPDAFNPSTRVSVATLPGMTCTNRALSEDYGTAFWYTPCASYLLNNTNDVRQAVTGSSAAKALDQGSFFSVNEKNYAFYGKARVGFDIASIPVDGVFGVRVTKTDSDLLGYSMVNGVPVATPKSSSGTDTLPSASFKATLRKDLIARLAYAKTLTRPDFSQLNPGTAYVNSNGNTVQASASGGNPDLKPVTGQNVDAALEWYFAPAAMVSGTVFRHNFDGYIVGRAQPEVYQGVNYLTTRPFNTDKGHLQGVELSYQQFYDKLPGWLSGIGTQLNYTYMEGGVTSSSIGPGDLTFPGMSKNSYNIVLLYEKNGISGRLAYNWRSKFVQVYGDTSAIKGTAPNRDLIAAPTSSLDGSISYKFTPNLSLTLTGTNLLNFKYVDYWTDANVYPRDTRRYDRTVGLMLNWKN
ncbi:TonB-dependent receptor [Pseudoduganella eburnea]|uniref:TonB-dependent receptor n=1 Tax=Massilia eburnea TaxID=1776165 RepID=A0A6L6QLP4_9BURK|nr:TonB-dependent receptor [Massilia eburnea]MTW13070.1 TonB-dependent receptor [Massilia eburnea]